jgi:hypothetical protein
MVVIIAIVAMLILMGIIHYQYTHEQSILTLPGHHHHHHHHHHTHHGHGNGHGGVKHEGMTYDMAAASMNGVRFPIGGLVRRMRWPADKPFSADQVIYYYHCIARERAS